MLYLQTSHKARAALGLNNEAFAPPGQTNSALGNWMVTVVPIGRRRAYVFMSCRSLLSFPVMIGKNVIAIEDMPALISYGLTRLMAHMRTPSNHGSRLLADLNEIAVCKATDKSMIGVFRSVASDYDYRVGRGGGLAHVDMDDIVYQVNSIPRATLGFRTSFEVSGELLQGNDG